MPVIRVMQTEDLLAVMAIQLRCYQPQFHEPRLVLQQRLVSAPNTAWVASDAQGISGYLVAYPSLLGRVTALQGLFKQSEQPNVLYLHDLAVHPRASGQQIAAGLIAQAIRYVQREQLRGLALVAVQGSTGFWQHHGFVPVTWLAPDQQSILASYGESACYMQHLLKSPEPSV